MAKESACQCRRQKQEMRIGSLGQEDPWRREWQPTPVFLPKKFHGQRSLTGYSSRDPKELDMTEHACKHARYLNIQDSGYFLSYISIDSETLLSTY